MPPPAQCLSRGHPCSGGVVATFVPSKDEPRIRFPAGATPRWISCKSTYPTHTLILTYRHLIIAAVVMEYLPGVCAGISQTLVGHPFDTLKTLIQNGQSWREIGIRGYYRGVIPPLIGSTLFTGILFPTYHALDDILCQQHWLSGAIAGLILTPTIFTL
jgi:hypothetical protein